MLIYIISQIFIGLVNNYRKLPPLVVSLLFDTG